MRKESAWNSGPFRQIAALNTHMHTLVKKYPIARLSALGTGHELVGTFIHSEFLGVCIEYMEQRRTCLASSTRSQQRATGLPPDRVGPSRAARRGAGGAL